MRKLVFLASVLIVAATFNKANAQSTGTTNMTVALSSIQSIVVNDPTVLLNFVAPADYSTGVTVAKPAHLSVTSTGKFFVKVKASDLELIAQTGATGANIPVSTISLTSSLAGATFGTSTPATVSLTNADQTLYNNTEGTTASNIDVSYKALGGANYLNRTGNFSTTLTYTISAL